MCGSAPGNITGFGTWWNAVALGGVRWRSVAFFAQVFAQIFGLIVPQHATGEHLKHLAAIAEKFSEDSFCEQLRSARDAHAVFGLLTS